jgi:oligo-alginate lyase
MPLLLLSLLVLLLLLPRRASAKDAPVLFDSDDVNAVRSNIARYDWAKEECDFVLAECQPWIEMADSDLWDLVTGQAVPRGIHTSLKLGCPSCGREVYNHGLYPWILSLEKPWKIQCPSCGEVYPKNDFAAFHESGRGANGVLDPGLADRSLLYNQDHPDPEDPLHLHAVDDGLGWVDPDGNRWWFAAYYNHWCIWRDIPWAAHALGLAYVYTGEQVYAHKGAVLLDRIADVYPEMDISPYARMGISNSDGGRGTGRIKGCIWENGVAESLSQAYDLVYDGMQGDQDLIHFLSERAEQWKTGNRKRDLAEVRENIETNLLREFIKSCRDRRNRGNEGVMQAAMATAAAVLDHPTETPAALDWLMQPGTSAQGGGRIPDVLTQMVDRHGIGDESSPSYCFLWLNSLRRCARVLQRCARYRDYDLFRDYPRLTRMHAAPYRLSALDTHSLHIGDTGKTGDPILHSVNLRVAIEGLKYSSDPCFARLAWKLNGEQARELRVGLLDDVAGGQEVQKYFFVALGLHTPIFERDIEGLLATMERDARDKGALELGNENLNGYGAAIFRSGEGDARRAAWLYYGRNLGHGHRDRLNFGLYYRGMDITPEHGNPEYKNATWPNRAGWTNNTLSHNTVMVDRRQQDESWTGRCALFSASDGIGVVEVSSPEVYREVNDYRRTLASVDISESESYVIDVFRVDGGEDHVLSFHGAEGDVTVHGLDLVDQDGGTYAGPDIPHATHYDGPPGGGYRGSGFGYLYDVARSGRSRPGWHAEWSIVDTWGTQIGSSPVRLRYHGLSPSDEVATASGNTPRTHPGNPEKLRYLLQRRRPGDGRSLLVSALEPYSGDTPNLAAVERIDLGLDRTDLTAAAVRVVTRDGREDRLLSSTDAERMFDLGGGIQAAGRFALASRHDDRTMEIYLLGGTQIDTSSGTLTVERARFEGTVTDLHRQERGPAWIEVEGDLPEGNVLAGAQIRILNDGARDACYTVGSVDRKADNLHRLHLGDTTLVRGFADRMDYGKGYTYNIEPGQPFDIQTEIHLRIRDGQAEAVRATAGWKWET